MPYTVREPLRSRLVPRMALANLNAIDASALVAQIDARIANGGAVVAALPAITDADFNSVMGVLGEVRAELISITGAVPARIELRAAQAIAGFDYLASTGSLPADWSSDGGGGRETPWLFIGLGIAAIGGGWWWARGSQQDAMISAALESGDMEDCGCGG